MVSDEVKAYLAIIGRKGGLKGGSKGGSVCCRKGLACLSSAKRREIAMKGVLARRKK